MKENPKDGKSAESRRRLWPVAVAASLLLHLAVVLAFSLAPSRAQRQVNVAQQPAEVRWIELDEGNGGEVQFVSATPSRAGGREEASEPFDSALVSSAYQQLVDAGNSRQVPNGLSTGADAGPHGNGGPGVGGAAGGATASFFRITSPGRRIVYVIDASSSMGKNGAFAAARQELIASVRRLDTATQFQVIVYNSQARPLLPRHPGWLLPSPGVLEQVTQALAGLILEGRTEHAPAFRAAFALRPDTVYFLTDADDLAADHLRLAQQLNQHGAVIHTIELTLANRQRAWMPLQALARHHRGEYQAVEVR